MNTSTKPAEAKIPFCLCKSVLFRRSASDKHQVMQRTYKFKHRDKMLLFLSEFTVNLNQLCLFKSCRQSGRRTRGSACELYFSWNESRNSSSVICSSFFSTVSALAAGYCATGKWDMRWPYGGLPWKEQQRVWRKGKSWATEDRER